MRIVELEVHATGATSGILDGLLLRVPNDPDSGGESVSTICLIGRNGSGKSQFLQTLAEIFQDAWHTHAPREERDEVNPDLLFSLVYEMHYPNHGARVVRLSRRRTLGRGRPMIEMEEHVGSEWTTVDATDPEFGELLPPLIIGYTSGANETLSQPFLRSRAGYAHDVSTAALSSRDSNAPVADNRLLLVDYGTNLEVLIANLMLGSAADSRRMLEHANLQALSSWRCVVRLLPSTVTKTKAVNGRRGVKLTAELERTLATLSACSTTQSFEEDTETYIFDFWVDESSRAAFRRHWHTAADLYRSFHKLALLNDLAVPRKARIRVARQIETGHFSTRLPEPQDEDKVFRFEEVKFVVGMERRDPVDYVALSDGEHQQAQILGILSMIDTPNALFLFDEPESHFNPEWRVQFVKKLQASGGSPAGKPHVILTTHAPFVPSDMRRENVIILERSEHGVQARTPNFETFGARFDRILRDCFQISPPISQIARDEIETLMESSDADVIEDGLRHLGGSVEKAILLERLARLREPSE